MLIVVFTSTPILRHFKPALKSRIKTNASIVALVGIFSQLFEDRWYLVVFFSRKLVPAECNYETYNQELLAIVACFKH